MNKKDISRASHTGFHFYNLYQNCPRKFFLRYLARLVPETISPELAFGTAFHEGKAVFYNTKSESKAIRKAKLELEKYKSQYYDFEVYKSDLERVQILLDAWIHTHGYDDLQVYKILAVEKELTGILPNGMLISGRIDLIVQDSDGYVYIFDTKTSGSSWKLTELNVYNSDQATTYIWLVKQNFPSWRVVGLIADIAYWSRKTTNPNNILFRRGDIVIRTKYDLKVFEDETSALLMDISQRVEAWKKGLYNNHVLFPKNTFYCSAYFRECEYRDICRGEVSLQGKAPHGFKRDRLNKKLHKITQAVEVLS